MQTEQANNSEPQDTETGFDAEALMARAEQIREVPEGTAPKADAETEDAPKEPVKEPEKTEEKKDLAAIARKEEQERLDRALKERDDIKRQLQEYESKKAESQSEEKSKAEQEAFAYKMRQEFARDPEGVAKQMGFKDAADMAKFAWGKALGEDADDSTKADERLYSVTARLEALERENRELKQSWESKSQQEQVSQQEKEYRKQLQSSLDSQKESLKALAPFVDDSPDEVVEALMNTAAALYKRDGEMPSEARVISHLEEQTQKQAESEVKKLRTLLTRWERAAGIETQSASSNDDRGKARSPETVTTLSSSDTAAGTQPRGALSEEDRVKEARAMVRRMLAED